MIDGEEFTLLRPKPDRESRAKSAIMALYIEGARMKSI
jgi:hypothetical protein